MIDDVDQPYLEEQEPLPPTVPRPKKPRGFAAISPEHRAEISRLGGVAAHRAGTAHRFTSDEAASAGRKGGLAPHRSRGRRKVVV